MSSKYIIARRGRLLRPLIKPAPPSMSREGSAFFSKEVAQAHGAKGGKVEWAGKEEGGVGVPKGGREERGIEAEGGREQGSREEGEGVDAEGVEGGRTADVDERTEEAAEAASGAKEQRGEEEVRLPNGLVFTRYCFTSRPWCTNLSSLYCPHPPALPTRLQCNCNTIAQYSSPPPTPC